MTNIKCKNCGYEWNTNSLMFLVSCPRCGNKTKRDKKTIEDLNKLQKSKSATKKLMENF